MSTSKCLDITNKMSSKQSRMDVDDIYRHLGNFGRYQIMVWLLLTIPATLLPAWQMMSIIFVADQPPFHCKAVPGYTLNQSVPSFIDNNGESAYSQCKMYDDVSTSTQGQTSNKTVKCTTGWDYQPLHGETTIVMEWDLVCDRDKLAETAQSIYFVGVLFGAIFTGQVSDLIGRKKVFLGALLFEAIFGTSLAFVHTYPMFVFIWFCVGFFEQGVELTRFVIVMELFSAEKRTMMGAVHMIFWGVGVSSTAAIAYAFPDWRTMQIAISVPCLICIPSYWLLLESVRWLVSTGNHKQAEKTLRKIAKMNKVSLSDDFFEKYSLNDEEKKKPDIDADGVQRKYSALDLFRTPNIRKNALIMFYSCTANAVVYFGLSLYSAKLAGNKYINFFLLGLVEIPAHICIVFMMMWWGRRPSMFVFLIGAGIFCIITACLPEKTASGTDLSVAIKTTAAIGKFCISISFGVAWLYATEIFPTVIRNVGFGSCSLWARVGGIVAPFIIYLEKTSHYLPLNIFGVMSLTAGLLGLWLPETRNRALPETIEDGENLHNAPMIGSEPPQRAPSNRPIGQEGYKHVAADDFETSVTL